MKYKHHPKQEYPEYDEVTGISESPDDFRKRIHGYIRDYPDAFKVPPEVNPDVQQGSGITYSPERPERRFEIMEDYYEGFKSSLATPNPVQRSTGKVFNPEHPWAIFVKKADAEQKAQEWMERHAEPGYEHISAGLNPFNPSAIDWCDSRKVAEQERQEEDDIERAIDQVESQKQQAGFYSDLLFRTGQNGEALPNPRYAMTENGVVETRPWEGEGEPNPDYRTPTLFERFNSLCTPAQYVQLKNEIRDVYYQWLNMSELCKYTLDGFKPEATVPWPKELEGFTEEIIESL